MLITIRELREAISNQLVETSLKELINCLLTEGTIDDIKARSDRHSEEWDEVFEKLQILPQAKLKQYLTWLERVSRSNQEPLRDISPLIISFDKAKSRQKLKGKDTDINAYKTPGDLHRKLEELPDDSKIDFKAASGDADKVYESDNFVVLMPRSLDASCALGRGTAWCTARTKGENLFYNYIINDGVILYYVLDKHDKKRKWSIGAVNGEVQEPEYGSVTVDEDNDDFDFSFEFEEEEEDIINAITLHSKKVKEHPAIKDIKKAVTSVSRFKKLVKGMRVPAILALLSSLESAGNKLSGEVSDYTNEIIIPALTKMTTSENEGVREEASHSSRTPPELLATLASDDNWFVRRGVARNPSTPEQVLMTFIDGDDKDLLAQAAMTVTDPKTITMLAKRPNQSIQYAVLNNKNASHEVFKILATNDIPFVTSTLSRRPALGFDIYEILAKSSNAGVRRNVAENLSTPDEIVVMLRKDKNDSVKFAADNNY